MTIGNPKRPRQFGWRKVEVGDNFIEDHALSSQIARYSATSFPRTFGKDAAASTAQTARMGKKATRDAANHIRAWRDFRKMSQAEVAALCDTKDNVISNLESGERQLTEKWLVRLARALKTTPGYLLDHDPNDLDTDLIRAAQEAVQGGNREQVMQILRTFKTGTNG